MNTSGSERGIALLLLHTLDNCSCPVSFKLNFRLRKGGLYFKCKNEIGLCFLTSGGGKKLCYSKYGSFGNKLPCITQKKLHNVKIFLFFLQNWSEVIVFPLETVGSVNSHTSQIGFAFVVNNKWN